MSRKHSIEDLKDIAKKLISNNHSSEYIIEFKRLEEKELNKKYDVYYIRTDKNKYILKKSQLGYEADIYETFFNDTDIAVPKYYGKVKDLDNNVWFLLEYIDGKAFSNESLESYCTAATELALMHSSFLNIKFDKHEYLFVRNENEVLINNINKIIEKHTNYELNWTKDILEALKSIADRLGKRPKTILENDLLPMNIMIKDEKIKFIDWEFAAIGCYTLDIGRLLSDFRDSNGVNWVKSEWEQDILNAYFTAICKNGLPGLSREEFLLDYQCSRLINYARIVFAHILNNWEITDWYRLNFKSMVDIINKLEKGML
jgi:thiamine kinase-like enzyme